MPEAPHHDLSRRERQIMDILYSAGAGDGRRGPGRPAGSAELFGGSGDAADSGGQRATSGTSRTVRATSTCRPWPATGRSGRRCATSCRPSSTARRSRRSPPCWTSPIRGFPIASSIGWPGSSIRPAAPERNDDHSPNCLSAWLPLADAVVKATVILLAAAVASSCCATRPRRCGISSGPSRCASALVAAGRCRSRCRNGSCRCSRLRAERHRWRRRRGRTGVERSARGTRAPWTAAARHRRAACRCRRRRRRPADRARPAASAVRRFSWQQMLVGAVAARRDRDPRAASWSGCWRSAGCRAAPSEITDAPWLPMARAVARDMAVTSRLRFLRSGRASMPVAAGIFRPAVIMPADADTLVREPPSRRAAARARAREAARLPDPRARRRSRARSTGSTRWRGWR